MAKKLTKKRSRSQPLQSESTNHGVSLQEQRKNAAFEFEKLGLCSQLASTCARVGWAVPSNVQRHCIPRILVPYDQNFDRGGSTVASPFMFGLQAPPGSGKTASYVLPILHHLMNSKTMSQTALQSSEYRIAPSSLLHFLSTLIIAPTTELCLQIYNQILLFGESVRIKVGLLVGGGARKGSAKGNLREQLGMIQDRTVHIIVGTPGRVQYVLLDSAVTMDGQNALSDLSDSSSEDSAANVQESILKNIRFFVFDEADMMAHEKSMMQIIDRLLRETVHAQHALITSQTLKNEKVQPNVQAPGLPQLTTLLVSATLKHSTMNSAWTSCLCALNDTNEPQSSHSEGVKPLKRIDFAVPDSYQSFQIVPPIPETFIANDTMSLDALSATSFNKFIDQQFVVVPHHVKLIHLYAMLSPSSEYAIMRSKGAQKKKTIVFFNSKMECEVVRTTLQLLGLSVCSLHSLQSPQQRSDSLFSFQMGVSTVLLTTDVCCRGLDIAAVDYIVHFDIPHSIDRYVHRIGRARRESEVHGKERIAKDNADDSSMHGSSILFATEKDEAALRKLEKSIDGIMKRNANGDKAWKLHKRKDIDEDVILRHLDVVLQARLKAEEAFSNEFEKEDVQVQFM